jgi:hypothetical protein
MANNTMVRGLVRSFGGLVKALPEIYQPAGEAFLYSLHNRIMDSERKVPEEILGTIAMAVVNHLYKEADRIEETPYPDYEDAVKLLKNTNYAVGICAMDYPEYGGWTMPGYQHHPHYFVMGGLTVTPLGKGKWLVEDRYDWHEADYWLVPQCISEKVPNWVLKQFCDEDEEGWWLRELTTLSQNYKPYWHRSVVCLGDYLEPNWFE